MDLMIFMPKTNKGLHNDMVIWFNIANMLL